MISVRSMTREVEERLSFMGVSSRQEAKFLVQDCLGLSPLDWACSGDRALSSSEKHAITIALDQRIREKKPLSRLNGERDFWAASFALNPWTLDPRPESEGLIRLTRTLYPCTPQTILDMGTGSGCLLLSLLQEYSDARGLGIDNEPRALIIAKQNADRLGLSARARWRAASWDRGLQGRFDLFISNPPYIPSGDIDMLDEEVRRWDPIRALDGGIDGLTHYRTLIPAASRHLDYTGLAMFEIGETQAHALTAIASLYFPHVRVFQDDCGKDRYLAASYKVTL